jgi:hypothetical protein
MNCYDAIEKLSELNPYGITNMADTIEFSEQLREITNSLAKLVDTSAYVAHMLENHNKMDIRDLSKKLKEAING